MKLRAIKPGLLRPANFISNSSLWSEYSSQYFWMTSIPGQLENNSAELDSRKDVSFLSPFPYFLLSSLADDCWSQYKYNEELRISLKLSREIPNWKKIELVWSFHVEIKSWGWKIQYYTFLLPLLSDSVRAKRYLNRFCLFQRKGLRNIL